LDSGQVVDVELRWMPTNGGGLDATDRVYPGYSSERKKEDSKEGRDLLGNIELHLAKEIIELSTPIDESSSPP